MIQTNLQAVKRTLHLTNQKIGEATGISASMVSCYIIGKRKIQDDWIEKFCAAYGVDREWFYNGDGEVQFSSFPSTTILKDTSGAGRRVALMRRELGLKQKDVYTELGITQAMLSLIENEKAGLSLEHAKKLENRYGYGADWLLYGDIERKEYPVSEDMVAWLWKNPDERKRIWEIMHK